VLLCPRLGGWLDRGSALFLLLACTTSIYVYPASIQAATGDSAAWTYPWRCCYVSSWVCSSCCSQCADGCCNRLQTGCPLLQNLLQVQPKRDITQRLRRVGAGEQTIVFRFLQARPQRLCRPRIHQSQAIHEGTGVFISRCCRLNAHEPVYSNRSRAKSCQHPVIVTTEILLQPSNAEELAAPLA
jgi:hypothetical protein